MDGEEGSHCLCGLHARLLFVWALLRRCMTGMIDPLVGSGFMVVGGRWSVVGGQVRTGAGLPRQPRPQPTRQ